MSKTIYEIYAQSFRDKNGNIVDEPNPKKENLDIYLKRVGFDINDIEGHIYNIWSNYKPIFNYIFDNNIISSVIETGFNAGHSCLTFLQYMEKQKHKNYYVISFDLGNHFYSYYAMRYIDVIYPNKTMIIKGDSKKTLPLFNTLFKSKKIFNLIFIDGDHRFEGAYNDIIQLKKFSDENTILFIDNSAPHKGAGQGVYYAFKKAYQENIVIFDKFFEFPNFKDGVIIAKYKFKNSKKGNIPNWSHYERKIPLWNLSRKLDKITNKKELINLLDEYNKLKETDIFINKKINKLKKLYKIK